VVQPSTSYDDFAKIVFARKRSSGLDANNVRLIYDSLLEKVILSIPLLTLSKNLKYLLFPGKGG